MSTTDGNPVKLFADSANLATVIPLLEAGLVHGVTTNPTIINRDGHKTSDLESLFDTFDAAGARHIFMQATGANREELRASALRLSHFGPKIVVKVPATPHGFGVAVELISAGVQVLLTAVYSLAQATFAASIGAQFVAPYFGRLLDSGQDGLAIVSDMNRILEGTDTNVLVASIRSPEAAATLALAGVAFITADVPVILAMMVDPVTETSAAEFERIANL